jgi:hypothetical protein
VVKNIKNVVENNMNPFNKLMVKVKHSASSKSRSVRTGSGKARKVTINAKDLERKFKEQAGLCYWTGIPIDINLIFTSDYNKLAPSVDRIDSDKDYHYDNVCITFRFINYGIGSCSPEKARHYIKVITGNYKVTNNNKQQGDNMNIIDQIIAKGFDIGTPGAARFLRVFVETNGDFKSSTIKKTGESPYHRNAKTAEETISILKSKAQFVENPESVKIIPLKEWVLDSGYASDFFKKKHAAFSGNVGKKLANGIDVYYTTENPSWNNMAELTNQLYVNENTPNAKSK